MEEDGWDLLAVVRGCRSSSSAAATATATTTATAAADLFSSFPPSVFKEEPAPREESAGFPELWGSRTGLMELDELSKAFLPEPRRQPLLFPSSSAAVLPAVAAAPSALPEPQQQKGPHRPLSQMSRSKRRKNQQKRVVCHVPADGVSSDVWAWRKYGQKPIKGSPYPRGYYRCSSSKGCPARKQLERSRTDPGMFIITYTAEHNHPAPTHRNSLAGSTRTKFPSPSAAASTPTGSGGSDRQPPVPSPLSSPTAAGLSPTTPLTAAMEDELLRPRHGPSKAEDGGATEEEEEEESLMVEDMEMIGEDELVFMGSDELDGGDGGCGGFFEAGADFEDQLPPPWLTSATASAATNTAAAAGGR